MRPLRTIEDVNAFAKEMFKTGRPVATPGTGGLIDERAEHLGGCSGCDDMRGLHDWYLGGARAKLREVYDLVPDAGCKGLCWESCGPIDMGFYEHLVLRGALGRDIGQVQPGTIGKDDWLCPLLDKATRKCTVYEDRPLICRLWGSADPRPSANRHYGNDPSRPRGLGPCPHGCKPEGGFMSRSLEDRVRRMMAKLNHGKATEWRYSTHQLLDVLPLRVDCPACKRPRGQECYEDATNPRARDGRVMLLRTPHSYHPERMVLAIESYKEQGEREAMTKEGDTA